MNIEKEFMLTFFCKFLCILAPFLPSNCKKLMKSFQYNFACMHIVHVNVCESVFVEKCKLFASKQHINCFFILWDEIGRKLNESDFCRGLKNLDGDDFAKG